MRRVQTAFAAAFLFALAAPLAIAQDDDEARIRQLIDGAMEHMTVGSTLVARAKSEQGEAAERSRAEANAAYDQAVAKYDACLEVLNQVDAPEEAKDQVKRLVYYNTACARSMQGRVDEALTAFGQALEVGFDDFDHIATDTDLDPIRKEARFEQLIEQARARLADEDRAVEGETLSPDALFPYDFTVTTIDGQRLALADLRGKVVLVHYWGTSLPRSRAEVPHFRELANEFGDRLAIVGMTWEGGKSDAATVARVKDFAKEMNITFPLTIVATREELAKVPELEGLPATLFVDKQGRVRAKAVGYRDLDELRALVRALDAEPAPATPAPSGGGSLGPF